MKKFVFLLFLALLIAIAISKIGDDNKNTRTVGGGETSANTSKLNDNMAINAISPKILSYYTVENKSSFIDESYEDYELDIYDGSSDSYDSVVSVFSTCYKNIKDADEQYKAFISTKMSYKSLPTDRIDKPGVSLVKWEYIGDLAQISEVDKCVVIIVARGSDEQWNSIKKRKILIGTWSIMADYQYEYIQSKEIQAHGDN